jgi:hypothetical protein
MYSNNNKIKILANSIQLLKYTQNIGFSSVSIFFQLLVHFLHYKHTLSYFINLFDCLMLSYIYVIKSQVLLTWNWSYTGLTFVVQCTENKKLEITSSFIM